MGMVISTMSIAAGYKSTPARRYSLAAPAVFNSPNDDLDELDDNDKFLVTSSW